MKKNLDALGRLIAQKHPELYKRLNPGLELGAIQQLEHHCEYEIPALLKSLWHWHDGQDPLYYCNFHPKGQEMFISMQEAIDVKEDLDSRYEYGQLPFDSWSLLWIPFLGNAGDNYFCFDVSQEQYGQIFYFDRNAAQIGPRHPDFKHWFTDLVKTYIRMDPLQNPKD